MKRFYTGAHTASRARSARRCGAVREPASVKEMLYGLHGTPARQPGRTAEQSRRSREAAATGAEARAEEQKTKTSFFDGKTSFIFFCCLSSIFWCFIGAFVIKMENNSIYTCNFFKFMLYFKCENIILQVGDLQISEVPFEK